MAQTKYRYNEKTLRYERAGISVINISLTLIALLSFGALFFLGLFFVQSYFVNTPVEKALRLENTALREHQAIVENRLVSAGDRLSALKKSEEELYSKFFDLAMEKGTNVQHKEILLGDQRQFNETTYSLTKKYKQLMMRAGSSNDHFGLYASVSRQDLPQLKNFPGALPIHKVEPKMLVSGFGTRINPWHKGKYHHDGVDIAAARGTPVVATGDGKVTIVKKSDLQAGFGNYIEIDHGHGYVSRYTHLGEPSVRIGQKIQKGNVIAVVGVSGGSIAPHVHYEVLKDGKNIDPTRVMVEGISSSQFSLLAIASQQLNQSLD